MSHVLIKLKKGYRLPTTYRGKAKRIATRVYRVEVPEEAQEAVNKLSCLNCAECVEEDIVVTTSEDEPFYSEAPIDEFDNMYWQEHINVRQAWKYTKGAGVKIGIIDTGIDLTNESVAHAVVDSASLTGEASAQDLHGHGTMVASCIVGRIKGLYSIGVAPEAKLAVAKANVGASGSFYMSDIIMAMDWCVSKNVHILNMSLGSFGPMPIIWQEAVDRAIKAGVTVFAASGNHADIDYRIGRPANGRGVVAVGAHFRTNHRSKFSAWGSYGADGKLDVYAPGQQVYCIGLKNKLVAVNGTSFASPIAAGCFALIKAQDGDISHDNIRGLIEIMGYPTANFMDGVNGIPTKRIDLGVLFNEDKPMLHTSQRKYSRNQRIEITYFIPKYDKIIDVELFGAVPAETGYYLDTNGRFVSDEVLAFVKVPPAVSGLIGILFGHVWTSKNYNYPMLYPSLDLKESPLGEYSLTLRIYAHGTKDRVFDDTVIKFELVE